MNMIETKQLSRRFRVAEQEGSFGRYLLRRKYSYVEAVRDVSFSIKKGEAVGFIGPNGAGKSTVIKMMTGILVPSGGEIRVLGNIPHKNRKENAKHIGVLFGQRSQLWWDLPVSDTFVLLKKIYQIPDTVFEKNLEKYRELLGLEEFYGRPVRQLSLGQRMRADLCAALLHSPELLFLDEPTIGLDVVAKKQIREMVKEMNQTQGVTVILTTHDMKDIEEICQRLLLINQGRIILDRPLAQVKDLFRGDCVITFTFDQAPEGLSIPYARLLKRTAHHLRYAYHPEDISSAEIISRVNRRCPPLDITMSEPDIEEIIRKLYQTITPDTSSSAHKRPAPQ